MSQPKTSSKYSSSPPANTAEDKPHSNNLGILIFTWSYWVYLFFLSLFCFLFTFSVFLFTFPFDKKRFIPHMLSASWAKLAVCINPFWHVQIEGRKKIEWGKTYILVSNHQSNFDIFFLFQLFRFFKWISKIEVLKYPFVGWGVRMNRYIYFDRKNPHARVQVLEKCRYWLQKKVSVFFFPEGTRSKTGELQPFKPGAFHLAIEEKIPVVPIAIHGTRHILGKKKLLLGVKAQIRIQVLEPISPQDYSLDQVQELSNQTRETIRRALEEMASSGH